MRAGCQPARQHCSTGTYCADVLHPPAAPRAVPAFSWLPAASTATSTRRSRPLLRIWPQALQQGETRTWQARTHYTVPGWLQQQARLSQLIATSPSIPATHQQTAASQPGSRAQGVHAAKRLPAQPLKLPPEDERLHLQAQAGSGAAAVNMGRAEHEAA